MLKKGDKRGSSLIEMVLVLCIIALFALGTIPLILSGSNAYNDISKNQLLEGDARIAVSFIQMKLKQNDVNGNISVQDSGLGSNALRIQWTEAKNTFTYIYFHEEKLMEYISINGQKPDPALSQTIAEIKGFDINLSEKGNEVLYDVEYESKGRVKRISSRVELRSEKAEGGSLQ